jgi:hypothetical protein
MSTTAISSFEDVLIKQIIVRLVLLQRKKRASQVCEYSCEITDHSSASLNVLMILRDCLSQDGKEKEL